MSYSFKQIGPEVVTDYGKMVVTRPTAAMAAARRILANRERYLKVAATSTTPWFVIALIHYREADLDFRTHLHNGDPLAHRTVNDPAGRPTAGEPPFDWDFSALDALSYDRLDKVQDWSLGQIGYQLELYNGFGPRGKGVRSGYVWAGSNIYSGGKYIRDHVWDAGYQDTQLGCMVVLKALTDICPEVAKALSPSSVPRSSEGSRRRNDRDRDHRASRRHSRCDHPDEPECYRHRRHHRRHLRGLRDRRLPRPPPQQGKLIHVPAFHSADFRPGRGSSCRQGRRDLRRLSRSRAGQAPDPGAARPPGDQGPLDPVGDALPILFSLLGALLAWAGTVDWTTIAPTGVALAIQGVVFVALRLLPPKGE